MKNFDFVTFMHILVIAILGILTIALTYVISTTDFVIYEKIALMTCGVALIAGSIAAIIAIIRFN